MKIICGTDFSPNSRDAARTAAALAHRFKDVLELVHATLPPIGDEMIPEVWIPVHEGLDRQLQKWADELQDSGAKVQVSLEIGSAVEVLRQKSEEESTRMLVVSSIGQVALTRALLGSTADRIAESASAPTLVVRTALPFLDWMEGRRPLRVLVAVDFSQTSDQALGFVRELAGIGPCELMIGHIPLPDELQEENMSAGLREELREKVSTQLSPHPVKLLMPATDQNLANGLIQMAQDQGADLLVTGAHQHHGLSRLWHRSISRQLLMDSSVSVLVVPLHGQRQVRTRIPRLSRVLVTTDLSPAGNRAIPAACALLPQGGFLRMLHVLPKMAPESGHHKKHSKTQALSADEESQRIQLARGKVGSLFPAEAFQKGIIPEILVVTGDDVAETILEQAQNQGAHVICMASRGHTSLLSSLLGSVSEKVLHRSHRPVHLVLPGLD